MIEQNEIDEKLLAYLLDELDDVERDTEIVEVDLHVLVGDTGLIRIEVLKVAGARDEQDGECQQGGCECYR